MLECRVVIANKLGLHARAASKFIQLAKSFPSKIEIGLDEDHMVNGKSIMNLLTLTAGYGTEVLLRSEGDQEKRAMEAIVELINSKFGEE